MIENIRVKVSEVVFFEVNNWDIEMCIQSSYRMIIEGNVMQSTTMIIR